MSEPGYLMKFKYAYDKQFNAFFATMLLGAAAVYALFATDSLVCDTPRVVGTVAAVIAAALAAGRITYEIFKPSTKMEEVEQQEPSVEGYQRLR